MLIPVGHRSAAGANWGKNDEEEKNYNNIAGAASPDRTRAGWLWRKLDHADPEQHGLLGKLAIAVRQLVLTTAPFPAESAVPDARRHHDHEPAHRNRRECLCGDTGRERRNLPL